MPCKTSPLDDFVLEQLSEFVLAVVQEQHPFSTPQKDKRGRPKPIRTTASTTEFRARARGISSRHNGDTAFTQMYRYLVSKPERGHEETSAFLREYSESSRGMFVARSVEDVKTAMVSLQSAKNGLEHTASDVAAKKTKATLAALEREEELVKTRRARLVSNLSVCIAHMEQCESIKPPTLIYKSVLTALCSQESLGDRLLLGGRDRDGGVSLCPSTSFRRAYGQQE